MVKIWCILASACELTWEVVVSKAEERERLEGHGGEPGEGGGERRVSARLG